MSRGNGFGNGKWYQKTTLTYGMAYANSHSNNVAAPRMALTLPPSVNHWFMIFQPGASSAKYRFYMPHPIVRNMKKNPAKSNTTFGNWRPIQQNFDKLSKS
jgi:hypothetical protein